VSAAARAPVGKWTVAVSVAFGSLMATIDTSIVNVAIPQIRGELGASLQEITWVTTAYMIAMVLIMPLTGLLGSLFGQKRVYLLSLIVFTIGSVMCGFGRSLEMLVVGRVVQGLGGGALQPTQQAILRQTFPPSEQAMAMAVFSMVIMVGPAIGPVIGGLLIDDLSWPWIFFVNLPVGLLGIYLTWRNVHEPADVIAANRERAATVRANFDWAGIILMAISIGALQYVLEEGAADDWFDSPHIVIGTFVAAVGLAAFIIRELTAVAPVVDLRMFKDPTFASGTAVSGVVFAMLMGSMFLLPVFTQELMHYSATQSGLVLLPRTLAMMLASPFVGRLYSRVPPALPVGFGVVLTAPGVPIQAELHPPPPHPRRPPPGHHPRHLVARAARAARGNRRGVLVPVRAADHRRAVERAAPRDGRGGGRQQLHPPGRRLDRAVGVRDPVHPVRRGGHQRHARVADRAPPRSAGAAGGDQGPARAARPRRGPRHRRPGQGPRGAGPAAGHDRPVRQDRHPGPGAGPLEPATAQHPPAASYG